MNLDPEFFQQTRIPRNTPAAGSATSTGRTRPGLASQLKNAVFLKTSEEELDLLSILEASRSEALRAFDQIAMQGADLLFQVKTIAPYLAGRAVAFVGDYDGSASLLGLLSAHGLVEAPSRMVVADFDERVLNSARRLADSHGFGHLLTTRPYNVFDPVPTDLKGQWDAFYTNPPYGASNQGESARLFISRGCELTNSERATGCVILPSDSERSWAREAMYHTQRFLVLHGWRVDMLVNEMHRYHLDDDASLTSSLLIAEREVAYGNDTRPMPYAGRAVRHSEIPHFYGRAVLPAYPQYIDDEGHEILQLRDVQ